jgi:hypothetical protein
VLEDLVLDDAVLNADNNEPELDGSTLCKVVFEAVFIANAILSYVRLARRVEIVRKKSSAISE